MASDKQIILITGAAAGIGLEAVRSLLGSEAGYDILLSGRKLEQAQAAVEQVESEFPAKKSNVVAMEIDVESDASIEAAVEQVRSKYGRLDALVNNAGMFFHNSGSTSHKHQLMKCVKVCSGTSKLSTARPPSEKPGTRPGTST